MAEQFMPDQIPTGEDDLRATTPAERYSLKKKKKSDLMLKPGQSSAGYVVPLNTPTIFGRNPDLMGNDLSWKKWTDTPIPAQGGAAYHSGALNFGYPAYALAKEWGPQRALPQTAATMKAAVEQHPQFADTQDWHKPIAINEIRTKLLALIDAGQITWDQALRWEAVLRRQAGYTKSM